MVLVWVCESDGGRISWGKRSPHPLFCFTAALDIYSPRLHSETHCEHGWNSSTPTASCDGREVLSQSAGQSTARLHCLRDNTWSTWSTSEPDILLSLHHSTTSQTDMAAPLISRAGLTDLLRAQCNGCMLSLRIQWNTNIQLSVFCYKYHTDGCFSFLEWSWRVSVALIYQHTINVKLHYYRQRSCCSCHKA